MPYGIEQQLLDFWGRTGKSATGYSPEYQQLLFQQGLADLQPQYQQAKRGIATDLAGRGFYSNAPYSMAMGRMGSDYMRSLEQFRRGIAIESGQAGERQRGMIYGAGTQGMLQGYGQEHQKELSRMDFEQSQALAQQQFEFQKQLMELQKRLGKKGFRDFLMAITGQAPSTVATYHGAGGGG